MVTLGTIFSLPHPLELEVAELIGQMVPCAEMVRFGKNGSDATAGAVRAARAFTDTHSGHWHPMTYISHMADVSHFGLDPQRGMKPIVLTPDYVDDIHREGGTILGTSRGPVNIAAAVENLVRRKVDMLFTIGGDGTILRTLQLNKAPIFGINVGSLGFLTCASSTTYHEAVESIAKDRINFSQRALLEARVKLHDKQTAKMLALNDAVLSRGELSRLVLLRTWVNGEALTEYQAAIDYPENLQVAKSRRGGRSQEVAYWVGVAYEALGEQEKANTWLAVSLNKQTRTAQPVLFT